MNGLEIESLNEAIIADKRVAICDSSKDIIMVMESYEEMIQYLELFYAVLIRPYHLFKKDGKTIWVSPEADLLWGNRLIGRKKAFIGEYQGKHWKNLRGEVRKFCERRLVVRQEWLDLYRHELIAEGLIS